MTTLESIQTTSNTFGKFSSSRKFSFTTINTSNTKTYIDENVSPNKRWSKTIGHVESLTGYFGTYRSKFLDN